MAEGEHPQCYFFGRDSVRWSLAARWNVFDFTISYMSLVLATIITEIGEGSYRVVVLLRICRLLRLATLVNRSPELSVIVAGLVSAVNSVSYILLVLLIAFYIYAVLGFYLFRQNDPARFDSVTRAPPAHRAAPALACLFEEKQKKTSTPSKLGHGTLWGRWKAGSPQCLHVPPHP